MARPGEKPVVGELTGEAWMWAALSDRDHGMDGRFVFGVKTTGIFCRASCPARRPKPCNVVFFPDTAAAVQAGFRACLRCRPDDGHSREQVVARLVEAACREIEARLEVGEQAPKLAELAEAAGLSAHYFHRIFRAACGITPRAYGAAVRARRAGAALGSRQTGTVTRALFEAGYSSPGRFYDGARDRFGMAPRAYMEGGMERGVGISIRFGTAECWLGTVLVAATADGVCAVRLGDDADELVAGLRSSFAKAEVSEADADFSATLEAVVAAIEQTGPGGKDCRDLALDVQGTLFEHKVWEALRAIPAGETRSYGDIARAIGAPKAVRAVGRACGANPVAVLTPCHRVVGQNGALTGYRWGVERKRALLERELRGRSKSPKN